LRLAACVSQESGQRVRALAVEQIEGAVQQPVEIQPVEVAVGLLDELEEVHGVGRRHHLTRRAHEADVQAADVLREVVVGSVTVKRLPRAVGRVVVTEALGLPRAAHHQRAGTAPHAALDLERCAVAEALGIVHHLAAERAQGDHLDRLAEDAREVLVQPGGLDGEAHHERPRTVSTGHGAVAATRAATLPRKKRATPVRPWVPMTIRSAR
jgi:hypothetical protein